MRMITKAPAQRAGAAYVYCPICTHTVEGQVAFAGKALKVSPGQKCPRCSSALDAGYVIRFDRAA